MAKKSMALLLMARRYAKENPAAVQAGIDKVAAAAKQAAPTQHHAKVDKGVAAVRQLVGRATGGGTPPPPRPR